MNARGSRDTGEALRPVSSSAIAVATMIQLINSVHSIESYQFDQIDRADQAGWLA